MNGLVASFRSMSLGQEGGGGWEEKLEEYQQLCHPEVCRHLLSLSKHDQEKLVSKVERYREWASSGRHVPFTPKQVYDEVIHQLYNWPEDLPFMDREWRDYKPKLEGPESEIYKHMEFRRRAYICYYFPTESDMMKVPIEQWAIWDTALTLESMECSIRSYIKNKNLPLRARHVCYLPDKDEDEEENNESFLGLSDSEGFDWSVKLVLTEDKGSPFILRQMGWAKGGDSTYMHRMTGSEGYEGRDFHPQKVGQVLRQLVDHTHKQTVPTISKLGSRISLAFSKTLPVLDLLPEQVEVIEDMMMPDGTCCTDGAGYIGLDLAEQIYRILDKQKEEASGSACNLIDCGVRPAVIQVRLFCHVGGFKGTLLVDPTLSGRVQVRKSMRKFLGTRISPQAPYSLDLVTAFRVEITSHRLAPMAVVLLESLGVDKQCFLDMAEEELKVLRLIRTDRAAAYSILKHHMATFTYSSMQNQALMLLLCEQPLEDYYIQRVLRDVVEKNIKSIMYGKVLCKHAFTLAGQPDPLGLLQEGEVFISHGLNHDVLGEEGVYEGSVVVTRYPMRHPGDVRKFNAVNHAKIKLLGDRGGVIFFSTKGRRSEATKICAGDFDGDRYLCIFNKAILNSKLRISAPKSNDPVEYKAYSRKFSPITRAYNKYSLGGSVIDDFPPLNIDEARYKLFEAFIAQEKVEEIKYKSDRSWRCYADLLGPASQQCLDLEWINVTALEAAKKGELYEIPGGLRKEKADRPPYIRTNREIKEGEEFRNNDDEALPSSYAGETVQAMLYRVALTYKRGIAEDVRARKDGLDPHVFFIKDINGKLIHCFAEKCKELFEDFKDVFKKLMDEAESGRDDDDEGFEGEELQGGEKPQNFLKVRKQASRPAQEYLETLPLDEQFLFAAALYLHAYKSSEPYGAYLFFVWDVCKPFLLGIRKRFEAEEKGRAKRKASEGPRLWKPLTRKEARELLMCEPSPNELKLYADADKHMRRRRR